LSKSARFATSGINGLAVKPRQLGHVKIAVKTAKAIQNDL
jgi:hypothetical protein